MIDTALRWLDMGIAVIPIGYRSKRPNTRYLNNGEWKEYQTRLPCRGVLNEWFGSITNIAIVCAWRNLHIVDFDVTSALHLWQRICPAAYQHTYTVATGRGFHYYYFLDDPLPHTLKWFGGEIKASGYCLIPPSVHPSGRKYEIVNDVPIMRIDSIYDIFPRGLFDNQPATLPLQGTIDVYSLAATGGLSCDEINQHVRITRFFNKLTRSGNGWFTAVCPLHNDHRASGWVDDNRNRYGCHVCVNGSLSTLDFYMRLNQCDLITAMRELSCYHKT